LWIVYLSLSLSSVCHVSPEKRPSQKERKVEPEKTEKTTKNQPKKRQRRTPANKPTSLTKFDPRATFLHNGIQEKGVEHTILKIHEKKKRGVKRSENERVDNLNSNPWGMCCPLNNFCV
jgi:hypothetical protein